MAGADLKINWNPSWSFPSAPASPPKPGVAPSANNSQSGASQVPANMIPDPNGTPPQIQPMPKVAATGEPNEDQQAELETWEGNPRVIDGSKMPEKFADQVGIAGAHRIKNAASKNFEALDLTKRADRKLIAELGATQLLEDRAAVYKYSENGAIILVRQIGETTDESHAPIYDQVNLDGSLGEAVNVPPTLRLGDNNVKSADGKTTCSFTLYGYDLSVLYDDLSTQKDFYFYKNNFYLMYGVELDEGGKPKSTIVRAGTFWGNVAAIDVRINNLNWQGSYYWASRGSDVSSVSLVTLDGNIHYLKDGSIKSYTPPAYLNDEAMGTSYNFEYRRQAANAMESELPWKYGLRKERYLIESDMKMYKEREKYYFDLFARQAFINDLVNEGLDRNRIIKLAEQNPKEFNKLYVRWLNGPDRMAPTKTEFLQEMQQTPEPTQPPKTP